ncbi:MAG TPA: YeeE/YedE thiosulfate transporter family protein [Burkholderiaceae bacterium]|nr:YeeE/YedE thiosulfate transporter family protein [Burkholderiaceae bacterium]
MTAIWLAATACVATMGLAIQRGATCTVAAVDEVLTHRRTRRLLAMLEASLWVAGGLALAQRGHLPGAMPDSFAPSGWTVAGGALLGLGAWINRACVFGAVARLGSGEWAYAITPLGFFVGCLSEMTLFRRPHAEALGVASPLFQAIDIFVPVFVLFVLWRIGAGLRSRSDRDPDARPHQMIWNPHSATVVIGVSFVITLLLVGRWAYTDVLADLAQAMSGAPGDLALPAVLLLALYGGALVGGWTTGRWRSTVVSASQLLRCFVGGLVMAWGSLMIPGSNDGLILIGIPLIRPYAWLGFASMFCAIAAAMLAQRAWSRSRPTAPAPAQAGMGAHRTAAKDD